MQVYSPCILSVIVCVVSWVSRSWGYKVVLTCSMPEFVIILIDHEFLMSWTSTKLRKCSAQHDITVDLGRVCWETILSSISHSLE